MPLRPPLGSGTVASSKKVSLFLIVSIFKISNNLLRIVICHYMSYFIRITFIFVKIFVIFISQMVAKTFCFGIYKVMYSHLYL